MTASERGPTFEETFTDPSGWLVSAWVICSVVWLASNVLTFVLMALHYRVGKAAMREMGLKSMFLPWRHRLVLRILLLVPVYSTLSLLSLFFVRADTVFAFLRAWFQALSVAWLFDLVVILGGGPVNILKNLKVDSKPSKIYCAPPCCCCLVCTPAVVPGPAALGHIRGLVYQFVLVHPLISMVALFLMTEGLYTPSLISASDAYIYLQVIDVVSSLVALYGLFIIIKTTEHVLKGYSINFKANAINLVIALTAVQLLIIGAIAGKGHLGDSEMWPAAIRAAFLNNALFVIELFFHVGWMFLAFPPGQMAQDKVLYSLFVDPPTSTGPRLSDQADRAGDEVIVDVEMHTGSTQVWKEAAASGPWGRRVSRDNPVQIEMTGIKAGGAGPSTPKK